MRPLQAVVPTEEQLALVTGGAPGVTIITGAAGSGKTTVALLRLDFLMKHVADLKKESEDPLVRALVLTFNRTLAGYVDTLAFHQAPYGERFHLEVSTFSRWAVRLVGNELNLRADMCGQYLEYLAGQLSAYHKDFILDEAQHVLGRFAPAAFDEYLTAERPGRGRMPETSFARRQDVLDHVIRPYRAWKARLGVADWNDVALGARVMEAAPYDVVIVDEAQDFNANSLRAVLSHVAESHHTTLVMDSAQRIYPASFALAEIDVAPIQTHRLDTNYRNTRQVARFAAPLLRGIEVGVDGALPDFTSATREGALPTVVVGSYERQLEWVMSNVVDAAIAADESVAFLSPRLSQLDPIRVRLDAQALPYADITRRASWPTSRTQIALSTLHSAKGLEFDHVIVCDLQQDATPHGVAANDHRLEELRRLLAMGIGRARHSVTLGHEEAGASTLIDYLDSDTFSRLELRDAAA
jgi:superfamily I DNA/RNA helicase